MSVTADRRRELLEEVMHERSRAIAELPALADEPDGSSMRWPAGIATLLGRWAGSPEPPARRALARDVAVVALAWLEAFDGPKQ